MVALANGMFAALQLWTAHARRNVLVERVKHAFAAGELIDDDWRLYDSHRGFNQYNDCLVLQMISNRSEDVVRDAFGPVIYRRDDSCEDVCRDLRAVVLFNGRPPG